MEAFQDRLARLSDLTPDELNALEGEMVAAFDAADAAGDVETMQQLADALDEVRAAQANAATAEEPAEAPPVEETVAASAEVETGETDTPETPEEPTETPETPEEPTEDAPAEAPAEDVPAEEPEATATPAESGDVVAEAEQIIAEAAAAEDTPTIDTEEQVAPQETQEDTVAEEVTSDDVPAENAPVMASAAPYVITAGGDIPGFTAGQTLADMDDAIDALTAKVNNLRGVGGEVRTVVASLKREFDEDKMLRRGDPVGNSEKVREIVRAGREGGLEALAAAGWCAPKTPIYDHVNGMAIGVTDTPVLDSFPSLGVDRGGIVWQPPYSLGAVRALSGPGSPTAGFGRWVRDATGKFSFVQGGATAVTAGSDGQVTITAPAAGGDKPCIEIPCPPEAEAELGAVPLCLCTDVLMSRANPEFIRHFTDLVMVAQARYKEQWALAWMDAVASLNKDSSKGAAKELGTVDGQGLGACRDILLVWRAAAANFRWENRLSPTQNLRVYAPSWLRDAMAADLTVQMPGDDTISISYAVVEGYIADLHLSPVWYIDDNPASPPAATETAFDDPRGFAVKAIWYMDLPGVIVHMDGGSLDLGVQRTKEDIAKNRFCEFAETFDGLAYMGPANSGWLIKGVTPILVRGGFAPAVAVADVGLTVAG